jgi:MFS transporter, MHS family, shikimate and dehydroshikimate transport protein
LDIGGAAALVTAATALSAFSCLRLGSYVTSTITTETGRPPETLAVDIRRILWSSVIGASIEWYDFLVYAAATALVFNQLFFPTMNGHLGLIAAFGAYAAGFLARPVGALVFGHFGDRLGRKPMLITTMVVMGAGTFLIGLLPTYYQVGTAAPVLLVVLRLLQGIGMGGEWAAAVLMVFENAPAERRGLMSSMVQMGNPIGHIMVSGLFSIVVLLPERAFLAWGWRVPFLVSIVVVGVGLFSVSNSTRRPHTLRCAAPAESRRFPSLK